MTMTTTFEILNYSVAERCYNGKQIGSISLSLMDHHYVGSSSEYPVTCHVYRFQCFSLVLMHDGELRIVICYLSYSSTTYGTILTLVYNVSQIIEC